MNTNHVIRDIEEDVCVCVCVYVIRDKEVFKKYNSVIAYVIENKNT